MGKIIIIAIIFYLFKDIIFGILGWIFERICDLLDFCADIKDKIEDIYHKRQRNKYYKERAIERQQRLADIDSAYAQQNYKYVVTLFREVMKDDLYSVADKMKYCHIAADSVCQIAETTREWEEARTWAMILKKRNKLYESEADELFSEISKRGKDIFIKQNYRILVATEALQKNDAETAKKLFTDASNEGNFAAMCSLTNLIISTMSSEADIESAKRWIEKLKTVDPVTAREYDEKFKQSPLIKCLDYTEKALKYTTDAKEASGDKYIELMLKTNKEWEKAYECMPIPDYASYIMKNYVLIAEEQKECHPKGNDSFEKFAGYYKKALEWAKLFAEGGSEQAQKMVEFLEAQVNLNNTAIQITEEKQKQTN